MNCEVIDQAKTPGLADEVIASIRQVYDPEIPINVYDLGLIYKVVSTKTIAPLLR